ncbi:MFS transporter [Goodfellowiella coeruleoviolacea]|uniref:MFS transporter, DHA2 family, multidrug resistance protein n=1 Tax=Goodfellowiella coeruleoviolacea TaxID=334858 RepID=A0AAE3KEE9_9PSEU|nr:MFS transporter [Goodfellowiella coeruleoviolacea]MCP2165261.1 MFS transporter, DHA2 family, multidrug resistance protein [Goodfellowiella coeruleoviolacea]
MTVTSGNTRAGRREWSALAVLLLPVLLVSMDVSVLYLALPALSAALAPSATELMWITDIYSFLLAGLLITMGALGDRIGRRRLLLVGAGAFGLASVLAAASVNPPMLIAARALLGAAGATLMPATLALVRHLFGDARQRSTAIAIVTGGFAAGAALGPLLGGALLQHFWWGAAFLVNVPVMAVLVVLGPLLLPESRGSAHARVDLLSAALSLGAVLPVVYGIKVLATHGLGGPPVLAIGIGVVLGGVFARRQRRLTEPLIDLALFTAPAFSAAVGTNLLAAFGMVGSALFTGQHLQLVTGMSPLAAGLCLLPGAASAVAGAWVVAALASRTRPAVVVCAGLAAAAAGFAVLARLTVDSGGWLIVSGGVLLGIGLATTLATTADLIIATAPVERAGAAGGLIETSEKLGAACGAAILGAVHAAIYRADLTAAAPAGLAQADTAAARATLAAALDVAARLPEPVGAALRAAAQQAFVAGVRAAMLTCLALVVAAAVAAAVLLGRTGRATGTGPGTPADAPAS